MPRRILILDTSVLCCLLGVPGKETCGPDDDRWDHFRISSLLEKELRRASTLMLPLASIIETGNHISQAAGNRFSIAKKLADVIKLTADGLSPWAAFTEQSTLWEPQRLKELAETWPTLAAAGTSIGDATIITVAEHFSKAGFDVDIVTGDTGLKAYQPISTPKVPRRRRSEAARL